MGQTKQVVTMASFFIDANVIANWLLVTLDINDHEDSGKYFKDIKKEYSKAYYSYLLLKSIYDNKTNNHHLHFFTSSLAVSEVISVIHEKYLLDYLYKKGVSFKYWSKYKNKIPLNKKDLDLISLNIIKNFYIVFVPKIIKLSNDTILQHTIDLIINKKCETPDAFLVSQSITNKCDYFITEDGILKKNLKAIKHLNGLNSQMSIEILKKDKNFIISKL